MAQKIYLDFYGLVRDAAVRHERLHHARKQVDAAIIDGAVYNIYINCSGLSWSLLGTSAC